MNPFPGDTVSFHFQLMNTNFGAFSLEQHVSGMPVPEPIATVLLGMALAGVAMLRRRRE